MNEKQKSSICGCNTVYHGNTATEAGLSMSSKWVFGAPLLYHSWKNLPVKHIQHEDFQEHLHFTDMSASVLQCCR